MSKFVDRTSGDVTRRCKILGHVHFVFPAYFYWLHTYGPMPSYQESETFPPSYVPRGRDNSNELREILSALEEETGIEEIWGKEIAWEKKKFWGYIYNGDRFYWGNDVVEGVCDFTKKKAQCVEVLRDAGEINILGLRIEF
jgi:hypothetical protein